LVWFIRASFFFLRFLTLSFAFLGNHLYPDPEFTRITVGPYNCTMLPIMTSTYFACLTPAVCIDIYLCSRNFDLIFFFSSFPSWLPQRSEGLELRFTIDVNGQTATSNDTISFPATPIINSISGCTDSGSITSNCPTEGLFPSFLSALAFFWHVLF
jgi:hypothetical protein